MKTRNTLVPVILLHVFTCLTIGQLYASDVVKIVENKKAKAIVVIADDPSRMASYAAEEFVLHVKKATGVQLSIVPESKVKKQKQDKIFIGNSKSVSDQNIDTEKLGPDVFVLKTKGNNLYVAGKEKKEADPMDEEKHSLSGTLFGVYELLERYLHVKWLWPGELGTYIPQTNSFIVKDLNEEVAPKLKYRDFRYWDISQAMKKYSEDVKALAFTEEGLKNYARDLSIFTRRHRASHAEKPVVGHYFGGWWKQYGEEHPDWFAMQKDGSRSPKKGENIDRVPMCVSNPELHQFIVEKAWDGGDLLRLGEADNSRYCQCPVCMSWDGPQPKNAKARIVSDRYARFWKTIYDMAVKRNPNVKVTTFLYVNYFPAPLTDIKLNENIYGEFVPFASFMIWYPANEKDLEWQKEQWHGWRKTGIKIGYRPNHTKAGYALPHVNTWQGGEFIRFANQHGMEGIDYDALSGQWAVKGPEHYMYFRLLVHPDQGIKDIRKEYFSAFGPAAASVEAYFDYWEEYNHQLKKQGLWSDIRFNPKKAPEQYPDNAFPPAEEILAKALKEAGQSKDKQFAERVKFLQTGLEHGKLSARFVDLIEKNDPGAKAALDELVKFRRAHEHTYISNYVYLAVRGERRFLGEKIDKLK